MQVSAPAESPSISPEPARSWWQFSLRAFLIVVTLLIAALAWFINGPERSRQAVTNIKARGGRIVFHELDSEWLPSWVPQAYYRRVRVAILTETNHAALIDDLLALPGLELIALRNSGLGSREISRLASISTLIHLDFHETPIDDACIAEFERLPRLTHLYLDSGVTDTSLRCIGNLTRLEHLSIMSNELTDAGLQHLASLSELNSLQVLSPRVTDAGLAHFRCLTKLKVLYLRCASIRGPGLAHLNGLSRLEELILSETPLDDSALPYLRRMTTLNLLDIYDTNVTEAGIESLLELPNLYSFNFGGSEPQKEFPELHARWHAILAKRAPSED